MASRIDQFFASIKKRKALSPNSQHGKREKVSKNQIEGSPNAKSSLESYLATSGGGDLPAKSLKTDDEKAYIGHAKRCMRLDDDMPLASMNENHDHILTLGQCSKPQVFGASTKCLPKDSSENESVTENSELKEFATEFLSVYCRDLSSCVNLQSDADLVVDNPKNHPTTCPLEEISSDIKHYENETGCPCIENEMTLSQMGNPSKAEDVSRNKFSKFLKKEIAWKNMLEPPASLRKCNHITPECKTGCATHVSFATMQLKHTSSLFSPGEAFWNEAITVADGLLAPVGFPHDIELNEASKVSKETCNSNTVENYGRSLINTSLNRARETIFYPGACSAVGPKVKSGKDLEIEASPLPVKHFDFYLEEKKLDEDTPSHTNTATLAVLTSMEKKQTPICHHHLSNIDPPCIENMDHPKENLSHAQNSFMKPSISQRKLNHLTLDGENAASGTTDKDYAKDFINHESRNISTPASCTSVKDCLDLINWLPLEICSIYKKKGISKLYPWQVSCLQVDGVLHNRNLVYCASTSAGKSFVAEIIMLRRILLTGKIALLVLPYVSICAEKAEHLEVVLEPVHKHVRSYYGNQGSGTLPKDTSVAVCTIEKANSLVNRLLEEDRLSELGIIIIDELHMVGDQTRGYLLELMLTKLRYTAGEGSIDSSSGESSSTSSGKYDSARGLQIVGMSATLPNVAAVADWLKAALYETDFRPVPLEEYIKVGSTIYNKEMEIVRIIPKTYDLYGKDPDHIVELCNEVVQEGHSVLIFCSSRKGCESTARHIVKFLKKFSVSPRNGHHEPFDVAYAIDSLRRSPAGLDPTLEETLPHGVAYHHAGLTVEERETVETCYRRGIVRVLTATSTLAAGVNLPARRVIFREPRIGRDFLDGTRYRQMAGRAGRTGIDTKGESILICKPAEVKKILSLLNNNCTPLSSCLSEDKNGMTHAILEVVAGGVVQTASDIHRYVRCTLLNSMKPFEDVVKSAQESLRWLCHKKFLEWSEETKLYTTTPLGRASFGSSLCPEESLIVLEDLLRARDGFVLASDLHLVYLVTPINVDIEPDWELYYERFMQLPSLDQSVGNRVGVQEHFLMHMAHGAPSSHRLRGNSKGFNGRSGTLSNEQVLRVCKRFYVALILSRLVQEVSAAEVCQLFKVARGMVQALQENAGRFSSMVSIFCERLGWHDLESLVGKFQNRVAFGVRAEIAELTVIPYVKGSRARALFQAGLRTPQSIAEASISEIVKAIFESSSWTAHAQGKMQAGVAKKIKNGARKIVLEKAEEARLAAFSAFKSLGLDLPQLCRPFLFNPSESVTKKDSAVSSGEESTSNCAGFDSKHILDAQTFEKNTIENTLVFLENKGDMSAVGLASKTDVKLAGNIERKSPEENEAILKEGSNAIHNKLIFNISCINDGTIKSDTPLSMDEDGSKQSESTVCRRVENKSEKGPMKAVSIPGGLDSFLNLWDAISEFFFDIHYSKKSEMNSISPFEIHGMAVCWENSPIYYINLPRDLIHYKRIGKDQASGTKDILPVEHQLEVAKKRWSRIGSIMGRKEVKKFTWNLKIQMQVLKSPSVAIQRFSSLHGGIKNLGLDLIDMSYFMFSPVHVWNAIDVSVMSWILSPDEERSSQPNLEKEVKKRLSSDVVASVNRLGRWKNQMQRSAHNGCCRRVAQTRALFSVLWKLLEAEKLLEPLLTIEARLVNVLADMEIWGIGVDMEGCLRARNIVGRKLKDLEKEAHVLAGKTFSLSMPADIANILFEHLQLPMPEGNRGKQHPSTDKHCLDMLRNEHPIVPVIKEHRSLMKLLNSTLGSICSLARLSMRTQKYTLHGHWLQTSTATGRLSMEEPNLQCVEHMVEFKMSKDDAESELKQYKINVREFLLPTQDDWLLLTADYSQIELRLMAHFSNDSSMIKLLSNCNADAFTMIAAQWANKHELCVSALERDQTKRLVYGILYGMGPNSLAGQLNCSTEDAAKRIQSFKKSFPGVACWLHEAATSCHQKGYVETLKGRKRFLEKIKFGNIKEKSKARRQAVNSICQGSAADIIKIAMICIHDVIGEDSTSSPPILMPTEQFQILKGRCRILLQVHDELVLEADSSVVNEAGLLLQTCMEKVVPLLVPLPVKIKIGRTWGSLETFIPKS